ncbi:PIG-L family deacetylase [Acidimicrobiia bacterium EGI L10123]|uniref:PIG-L deacetylase family protein n=1 Tax=Salinilacustrithrix flava TaxID=2957203 RepID=UPI003D7C2C16|nr:PIG-L family deacetylase [Acidimicrobiia bacterium EGI L10123]
MNDLDDVAALGTVLGIWAHPDDETYLSAGVMAIAAGNAQRVVVVSATAGERGTDDPVAWPPDRLAPVRRWEASAALAALGVHDHRWLGLPDGELARCSTAEQARRLAAIMDEVAPDTILTFGPDGVTGHPDHRAVSRWVDAACLRSSRRVRVLHAALEEGYCERFRGLHERFDVFMDPSLPAPRPAAELALRLSLTGASLDRKLVALRAQATQTQPVVEAFGSGPYAEWVAEEVFVDATAQTYGQWRHPRSQHEPAAASSTAVSTNSPVAGSR